MLIALGATAVEGLREDAGHHQVARQLADLSRHTANADVPSGVPFAEPSHERKRKVWEDFLQVMEKLEMPISTKQRNFFLKAG